MTYYTDPTSSLPVTIELKKTLNMDLQSEPATVALNYTKKTYTADKKRVTITEELSLVKSGEGIEFGENDLQEVLTANGL